MKKLLLAFTLFFAVKSGSNAQCVGTGADGAYSATSSTTIVGGTYNFTTFNIDPGVVVTVTGTQPLIIYCTGTATINGTLSANGGNGTDGITYASAGTGGIGVAGGGNGGDGTYSSSMGPIAANDGAGPGGVGTAGGSWSGGGGAGYSSAGSASGNSGGGFAGPMYGNADISGFESGSGGGGGSGGYECGAGGGGAGGGLIVIQAGGTLTIGGSGSITANGGNGGSDGTGNCGGGGGGSGGSIFLAAPTVSFNGSLSALGGIGGASNVAGSPYFGTGATGANGRIRVDYNNISGTGISNPTIGATYPVSVSSPMNVSSTSTNVSCFGGNDGSISVTVTGGTGSISYSWSPVGGTGATASSLNAGTYTCTISDMCGSTTETVTLTEPAEITTTVNASICPGQSYSVGSSTYTAAGNYIDVLTSADGCDSTINTNLSLSPLPNVATTVAGVTITATLAGATYQWVNCPSMTNASGTSTNQSYTPTANGSYAVIINDGTCSDTSACTVISTIGIDEWSAENVISIYPNPNNGTFTIQTTMKGNYTIQNELGQVVFTFYANEENNKTISIEGLTSGVYFVTGENSLTPQKIVVTK